MEDYILQMAIITRNKHMCKKYTKAGTLPYVRLAITTRAPFSCAPYASAFPAPPAPITTKSFPANGESQDLLLS